MKQETFNKVEPKFKVGDWVTDGYLHNKITDVLEDRYIVETKFAKRSTIPFKRENNYHLWTIKDTNNGDVIAAEPIEGYPSSFIAIYKKQDEGDFDSYCFVGFDGKFYKGENGHSTEEIHPATKEQRDLLFQKMKEAGYEWDAEKKELKKIDARKNLTLDGDLMEADCMIVEQKSVWSEDDEKTLNTTISFLSEYAAKGYENAVMCIDWLKSLKERIV